jgi:CheY-like chemotaxis protein
MTESGTVLVVEDEEHLRELMSRFLRRLGVTHHLVADSTSFDTWLAESVPYLVLMDLRLEGDSRQGIDLIRQMRSDPRFAAVPIAVMSAFVHTDDLERAREAGCAAYIRKPFQDREAIGQLIKALVAGKDMPWQIL